MDLVFQRVLAIVLGYEDLNDHDDLSKDQLLAALVGKLDPTGQDRILQRNKGHALAGKSTLNRLELTPEGAGPDDRVKKIVMNSEAIDKLFVDPFVESYSKPPVEIILDVDATDIPLYGQQEELFSTETKIHTVICRFTFSVVKSCFVPVYGQQVLTKQQVP